MESLVGKTEEVINQWLTNWEKRFSEHWGFDIRLEFLYIIPPANSTKVEKFAHVVREGGQIPFGTTVDINLIKVESKEKEESAGKLILYTVSCSTFPALCGTLLFKYITGYERARYPSPKNTLPLFIEFLKEYAAARKYSNMICSSIVPHGDDAINYKTYPLPNEAIAQLKKYGRWHYFKFKQNLLRAGFTISSEFVNKRTNHLINIFNINL